MPNPNNDTRKELPMQFEYVIKYLEKAKVQLEEDIRFYRQENGRFAVSDAKKAEYLADLESQHAEVILAIQRIREGRLSVIGEGVKPNDFQHFVVLDQSWEVLLRGHINENQIVVITYRFSAPEREVLEQYSDFAAILNMIPIGTLPTIQFGDEETINRFFLEYSK